MRVLALGVHLPTGDSSVYSVLQRCLQRMFRKSDPGCAQQHTPPHARRLLLRLNQHLLTCNLVNASRLYGALSTLSWLEMSLPVAGGWTGWPLTVPSHPNLLWPQVFLPFLPQARSVLGSAGSGRGSSSLKGFSSSLCPAGPERLLQVSFPSWTRPHVVSTPGRYRHRGLGETSQDTIHGQALAQAAQGRGGVPIPGGVQTPCGCGTWGHGLAAMGVLG